MIRTKKINYLALARSAAAVADSKKGEDIVILNVRRLTAVADYFLIVTANSTPQIATIARAIDDKFRADEGLYPLHREGRESPSWSVLDYGGLVVHVMSPATRALYSLEKIWSDAKKVK